MPESPKNLPNDPFAGRRPTSHERASGQPWDASYHDGPAPWDVGRPQPPIARVAGEGGFTSPVLDAGCGTGENALYLASRGLTVLGFDVAETALAIARKNAEARGLQVEFVVADALHLQRLARKFQSVCDSGLFHTFAEADERTQYSRSIAAVTEPGATLFLLCFSDEGPNTGPHPITQQALKDAFHPDNGWDVVSIQRDRVLTRFHGDQGAPAWFATIHRI